jgi:hypothetical protein
MTVVRVQAEGEIRMALVVRNCSISRELPKKIPHDETASPRRASICYSPSKNPNGRPNTAKKRKFPPRSSTYLGGTRTVHLLEEDQKLARHCNFLAINRQQQTEKREHTATAHTEERGSAVMQSFEELDLLSTKESSVLSPLC